MQVNNTEICAFAEVSNDIPIPEWCPLEDADQSLTNVDNRRCVYRCEDCGNIFTEAENAENDDALCLNCSSLKHSLVEEVTLREVLEEISRRDRTNYEYEFAFEDCSTEDLRKIASLMGYKINSNEVLC